MSSARTLDDYRREKTRAHPHATARQSHRDPTTCDSSPMLFSSCEYLHLLLPFHICSD